MTIGQRSLRAAFYTGNYSEADGIGRSVRAKVEALRAGDGDGQWQVTIFCQQSNIDDPAVCVRSGLKQLVNHHAFRTADIHVFEFGWEYGLMDALLFVPPTSKAILHYQGITPPELESDPMGYLASWKQQLLFHKADLVLASSPYTQQLLADFGIEPGKIRIVSLPAMVVPREPPAKPSSGPVNLLQVGRLVPFKGTLDIVNALAMLPDAVCARLHVRIVGSRDSADGEYLSRLDAAIADNRLRDTIEFVGAIDDEGLSKLYAQSDALLQPSYHEGYCLPVIEAYAHGCHVVAYNNSNLPHVAAGLGRVVPTGDVAALSAAIGEFAVALDGSGRVDGSAAIATDSGPKSWRLLQDDVRAYAAQHSSAAFGQSFRGLVGELLAAPSRSSIKRLDSAVFFQNQRTRTIRPADLRIKAPFDEPDSTVLRGDRIEYDRDRHGEISERLLFFGPYIDLPQGRWRVQVNADINGDCLMRLTRNFGTFVHEATIGSGAAPFEFEADQDIEQLETTLLLLPETQTISLRSILLSRLD